MVHKKRRKRNKTKKRNTEAPILLPVPDRSHPLINSQKSAIEKFVHTTGKHAPHGATTEGLRSGFSVINQLRELAIKSGDMSLLARVAARDLALHEICRSTPDD